MENNFYNSKELVVDNSRELRQFLRFDDSGIIIHADVNFV